MNTRIIAIIGITTGIIGAIILADWQSISYDPCTEFSLFHHPELADDYLAKSNVTIFPTDTNNDSSEMIVHVQELQVFRESVYNVARNECEEARISNHRCHWIPDSIISKELCTDCQPICRSVDRTLNFIQFLIGEALFGFSQPVCRVAFTAILSDQVRKDFQVSHAVTHGPMKWRHGMIFVHMIYLLHAFVQGIVMGFVTALSGVVLTITPFWSKWSIVIIIF